LVVGVTGGFVLQTLASMETSLAATKKLILLHATLKQTTRNKWGERVADTSWEHGRGVVVAERNSRVIRTNHAGTRLRIWGPGFESRPAANKINVFGKYPSSHQTRRANVSAAPRPQNPPETAREKRAGP
jgi:hypothetical protein